MDLKRLRAIAPADGRYADKVEPLRDLFSEYGLIRFRVLVEVRWLQCLADEPSIVELPPLGSVVKKVLNRIVDDFSVEDAMEVKKIERTTNHDVKAVEYFLRDKIGKGQEIGNLAEFIHFACTSEDINNLAYALMLRHARDDVLSPMMRDVNAKLRALVSDYADLAMLSRTHGQTASPTTVGKGDCKRRRAAEAARQSLRGCYGARQSLMAQSAISTRMPCLSGVRLADA